MKNETIKRAFMPAGLLFISGISFVKHLTNFETSDFTLGLLYGLGIGIMLLSLLFGQKCKKHFPKSMF